MNQMLPILIFSTRIGCFPIQGVNKNDFAIPRGNSLIPLGAKLF